MALSIRRIVLDRLRLCAATCQTQAHKQPLGTQSFHQQQTAVQQKVNEQEGTEKQLAASPLQHPDYFGLHKIISVKELFDARVHLGHKEGLLNVHMKPYIFGSRLGCHIIDLDQTVLHLHRALNVVAHIAYRDGVILFVSRNLQMAHFIENTAQECKEFANTRAWPHGLLTNSTRQFGTETRLPDCIILLSTLDTVFEQHLAVVESCKMLIPTVAIVDTNSDPTLITYPVPGNDDTPSSIELYCRLFKEAILRGKARRKQDEESRGVVES
ncbi:small ribosomal subunit protein uS2m-like [Ornithodoros turicata]|uniref:small ribosomal subunit protein uS2m-like n=1 Tax=Ornithodoros turicata TaxID=34597 RepID=UPI0031395932